MSLCEVVGIDVPSRPSGRDGTSTTEQRDICVVLFFRIGTSFYSGCLCADVHMFVLNLFRFVFLLAGARVDLDGVCLQLYIENVQHVSPKDNPKIAIAVFIENGYWGARWAGPIASLMIEKYLKRKISLTDLEIKVLNTSLESQYNPSLELKNKIHPKNKVSL